MTPIQQCAAVFATKKLAAKVHRQERVRRAEKLHKEKLSDLAKFRAWEAGVDRSIALSDAIGLPPGMDAGRCE